MHNIQHIQIFLSVCFYRHSNYSFEHILLARVRRRLNIRNSMNTHIYAIQNYLITDRDIIIKLCTYLLVIIKDYGS